MTVIDKTAPVMVTGATGYVAGMLVKRLLEEGLTVHAPVREPGNLEKLQHLNATAQASAGTIHYFEADLLKPDSYDEAVRGCQLVFHTASPFKIRVDDAQKDLIEPACEGTRNVLASASKTDTVKRVVLTSSCAAIYGDNRDLQQTAQGFFTEADWNTSSSPTYNPYAYSKTLAEKTAWQLSEAQAQWDLVVINPSLVIGPGLNSSADSESLRLVKQLGDGTFKTGVPRWGLGVVDVRDLAQAHYQAGFTPHAQGRHIISGHNTDLFALAQTLQERFGDDWPIPKRVVPKWLLWLAGPMIDSSLNRKMISRNADYPWKADNSKSQQSLGIEYRPMKDSMNEFFSQIISVMAK